MKHEFSLFAFGNTFKGGLYLHLCQISINGVPGSLFQIGWAVHDQDKRPGHWYVDAFWFQLLWLKYRLALGRARNRRSIANRNSQIGNVRRTANEAAAISADGFASVGVSSANAISLRDVPADGWFPFATFGDHPSPDRTYTQVFHKEQAEEMVATWNSIAGRFGRLNKNLRHRTALKFSVPIFENHIDMDPHDWSELKPLGEGTDMRVTQNSLEIFVKWNSANMASRGAGPLYPSALWWHEPPDDQRRVFPALLESIALVNNPNITTVPAWTANNQPNDTLMLKKLIEMLGLTANATEDDAITAVGTLKSTANAAQSDKTALQTANSAKAELETKLAAAESAKPDFAKLTEVIGVQTTNNSQVVSALETMKAANATAATANGILLDGVLDLLEKAGKFTAAERAAVKGKFTANIAGSAAIITELTEKKPALNTKEIDLNGNRVDISTANARQAAVRELVSKEMKASDSDYDTAYAKVSADKANAQLFGAMNDPVREAEKKAA